MEQETTDSRMLDLYEEMLYERSARDIRPVLYVSSRNDLECSVLMLLNRPPEALLAERPRLGAMPFGQHIRTS